MRLSSPYKNIFIRYTLLGVFRSCIALHMIEFSLLYFLKLSFKLTLRLKTRWPGAASLLSRQK